jgi:prepilin-type N-terminal cleavage/methylation domain-containing protein
MIKTQGWRREVGGRRNVGGPRNGFSLLEILLSLAILGGSLAVLVQIVGIGTTAAIEARALSNCRILCQTKLAEVLLNGTAGISPQSVPESPLESFDSTSVVPYVYAVEIMPGAFDGMLVVRVSVNALDPNNGAPIAQYSLTRWMIDPLLGLEEAELEEEAAKEAAAGTAEAAPEEA